MPDEKEQREIAFGVIRRIKHSDMLKCPFVIMVASHYRDDGSCKCDDPEERAMMIREWEYKKSDFRKIPLRKEG